MRTLPVILSLLIGLLGVACGADEPMPEYPPPAPADSTGAELDLDDLDVDDEEEAADDEDQAEPATEEPADTD